MTMNRRRELLCIDPLRIDLLRVPLSQLFWPRRISVGTQVQRFPLLSLSFLQMFQRRTFIDRKQQNVCCFAERAVKMQETGRYKDES